MLEMAPRPPRPDRNAPVRERLRYFRMVGAFKQMVEATKILRRDPMEIVDLREDVRSTVIGEREDAICGYTNSLDLAIYLNLDIPALVHRANERATLKHGKTTKK